MIPSHPPDSPLTGRAISNQLAHSTVYGPVIQADSVADVHVTVHEAVFTPPTPRQLPPVPAVWTDRTYDLVQLAAAVDRLGADSVRLIAISGPSGIGKTALATKFLHMHLEQFPGGALYADLRGYAPGGPASASEILARLLRSVRPGVRATSAEELGAWWRTATAVPDRPVCVLLDNATDADQVQALLPGGQGHVVVTTSRHVLGGLAGHGARFHRVEPLDDEAAQDYLVRQLGRERVIGERQATARIVRLSAGLPMALAVVVGTLAAQPDQPLAAATSALMHTRDSVRLSHPVLTLQEVAVTTALDDRYQQLPPAAATVYRRSGSMFPLDVDPALAAALSGLTQSAAREALDVLRSAGMIEAVQAGDDPVRGAVYRYHDSAREHAAERFAQEEPDGAQEVLRMALDFFLDAASRAERRLTPTHRPLAREYRFEPADPVTFNTDAEALAWLEAQQDNLRAAVITAAAAGLDSSVWQLTHALWPLLRAHHDYDLWTVTHSHAARAARNCQDSAAELEILGTWAVGIRGAGQHDEAIEAFDQVLHLARSANDGRGEAQALHELGATHLAANCPADAEPFLLQALTRRTELARQAEADEDTREEITFRRAVAITKVCLGQVQLLLERSSEAIGTLSSARATLVSLQDSIDAARALAWLARAHAIDGDLDEAALLGRQAVDEFDRAGSPRWRAHSRELLGQTLQAAGRRNDAEALYQRAVAIYTPISPRDADRVRQQLRALSS
ncbi:MULTISPECIES: tetratricopeptide repeat protein [Streptomyces]|uniref:Putative regulator protein n=1 Tax=Streptomyces zinciresistens K42 TaxID=700597 RepID=G2GBA3_9ACTN|nr:MULTISPECIES: tetratricopeptide repeat protein [Streptomyces]EGX59199.1 putative regulator protein [Streptomyces zinciresistens K42]MDT9695970.1 tetratricopeptide repeat protein [Streptomyces sp. P17]